MTTISQLRAQFQQRVCRECIYTKSSKKSGKTPSVADTGGKLRVELSNALIDRLGYKLSPKKMDGQTAGKRFEEAVLDYVHRAIDELVHLRPADFEYSVQGDISNFVQYRHLKALQAIVKDNREASTALGTYLIKPDVVISRKPIPDDMINRDAKLVSRGGFPKLSPLRGSNQVESVELLHASISCKLTLRCDRSQNARTEGLNLIRHRKGHTPHIAVVTGEPMPTRISSLALGTGDIDCVYHFALHELLESSVLLSNEAVDELLRMMVDGNRLRDIADLPFDLVA